MKCPYCKKNIEKLNAYDKVSHIKECESTRTHTELTITIVTEGVEESITVQGLSLNQARGKAFKWLEFQEMNHNI